MNTPLSPAERRLMQKIARLGGRARAKKLTRARRKEISAMGVAARQKKRNGT